MFPALTYLVGSTLGPTPQLCLEVVSGVRRVLGCPIITKLTPNVTRIVDIAKAAQDGGADAVSCINTVLGMAVDWRKQRPLLGNIVGGLSGPAIKPIALRCVYKSLLRSTFLSLVSVVSRTSTT